MMFRQRLVLSILKYSADISDDIGEESCNI